jgi:hypothetical protein
LTTSPVPRSARRTGKLERVALGKLKWLAVRDLVEMETSNFWEEAPDEIETEVFFFPAASHVEKEGTFTNTQRRPQWREKAVDPPGDARSEVQFLVALGRKLKARATDAPRDAALRALTWGTVVGRLAAREVGDVVADPLSFLFDPPHQRFALAPRFAVRIGGRAVVEDAPVERPGVAPAVGVAAVRFARVGSVGADVHAHRTSHARSGRARAPRSLLSILVTLFSVEHSRRNAKHFAVLVAGLRKILLAKWRPCE